MESTLLNGTIKGVLADMPARYNLGRGSSVQSAGGPRLKGRPGGLTATSGGKSASATCWPAKQGMAQTTKGGSNQPGAPHKSQCVPACGAAPEPASATLPEPALRLQMPPSLPVRTSSASSDTGASSADSTARKLSQAARRNQTDGGERHDERRDTGKSISRARATGDFRRMLLI